MSWVLLILLAVVAFAVLAFVLKAPRGTWEALGAALLFGVAGYGLQGHPGQPGAPKQAREQAMADPAALVEARNRVADKGPISRDAMVSVADGYARNGRFGDAAAVLRGVVEDNPKNGEAWLALANALVAHSDGLLTPASLYAYRRAMLIEPDSAGPPYFLGLAMAQSGRFAEAKAIWTDLLAKLPEDIPLRADIVDKMGRVDQLMASQAMMGQGR
ncbi:cytochrome C biosynthesis protein [Novosphingobium sp. PC22D]|uniref:tetratricopeptide repeat protein n=1 Tax=Novosphingobium sp. PC22D TaxID=1962403 RepID=UPI000BF1298C|nr:tetratricopeptide repeat protein [Novosphingobium sp. PC22D]PEQ10824.1 cytochrome C biosynthesis protein [Novosphingobium sp. PC22D]